MPEPKRILLVGPGHLGIRTFEALLRTPGPHCYVVAGRDAETARRTANLLRQYAAAFGERVHVESARIDIADIASTAASLAALRPDITYSAVTMQSWWVTGELPPRLSAPLATSCVGPWLPMHLTLIYELMQAVRDAGIETTVVNASYPDATHPLLATAGLAPHVGIGNIAIPLVGLRLQLAEELGVAVADVHLRGVFHHYVNYNATRTGNPAPAPLHLSAWIGSADPDDPANRPLNLDPASVFVPLTRELKRMSGAHFQHVTGATAAVVLRALLEETDVRTHAPGPLGLPGGYPIRITGGRVRLDLPPGLALRDAIRINERGGHFDGIEHISPAGIVRFRAENAEPLRRHLGVGCGPMALADTRERATELAERLAAYIERDDVDRSPLNPTSIGA